MVRDLCFVSYSSPRKGLSPISGERGTDLEEEVLLVSEAVGHPLDDLGPVVDSLHKASVQRLATVGKDALYAFLQVAGKHIQRFSATANGAAAPLKPEAFGRAGAVVFLEVLQVVSEDVHRSKLPVGSKQLVELPPIFRGDVLAMAQQQPLGATVLNMCHGDSPIPQNARVVNTGSGSQFESFVRPVGNPRIALSRRRARLSAWRA